MKIDCSEISFLIGRGGVSCHRQGWLNVPFMYLFFEIFLEFFSLQNAYKRVCMYLYKAAFSCLICSNYTPERLGAGNVIPPSSCNCCEPFAKANTHTHTKHKDDFPTHKKWEERDLITECILCLPFLGGDLPQCKAESYLDCTSNQSIFLMYLFSWLMAQTAGTQTLKALSVRDLDLTFHARPNVQVCVLSHTALHQWTYSSNVNSILTVL